MAEAIERAPRKRHCGHRLPTLVELIQSILQKYPDGGQILKELIQNADDAGATEVNFLLDEQTYGVNSLENPELARFQGAALYCHNNATFKEEDWEGIRNLMNSGKKEDPLKIGRFGIGFNSVYHITDLPSIASGDRVSFLDPHEEYFRDDRGRGNSVTSYYLDEELLQEETRDQFMPFHNVFGCNLEQSENYEGTLFRFPLRTTPSELSTKEYTKEMVSILFKSLQEEESVLLLFLKNICSISLHTRCENGEIERVFKVEIAEDSRDDVMNKRREFLSQAAVSAIAHSEYVMSVIVTQSSSSREYRWLIINQIGSSVRRISELAAQEKLPPWVGMALSLDGGKEGTSIGRIFCFLPLPPDVDCETGLPVHVHGAFALTDNRRGLVWPGADNKSSTAEWNKLLLENVAVDVYSKLLNAILQNSPPTRVNESSRSQLVYSTLPNKTIVKGHWQVILDPLFQKLAQENWKLFFAQHVEGNSWVGLQGAAICDRLEGHNLRATVVKTLLSCSQVVITNVPTHVLDVVDNYFPPSSDISPGLVRSVLKAQQSFKASFEDKMHLLEYILEDGATDDLQGVPLLPLANLEFSKFVPNTYAENPSLSVFVPTSTCRKSLLPNLDHRFLNEDIPTLLKDKLQALASEDIQSRNTTQLILLNNEVVLQNLCSCLPAEWFDESNEIVKWIPERSDHPSESWLEDLWSWINSNFPDSLQSFDGFPIIQLPTQDVFTPLGVLSKQSTLIFFSDTSDHFLPAVVVQLLEACGCTVVPQQSSLLRHSDIHTYIASATPTGVTTVLARTSLAKAKEHIKLCTKDERLELRDFFSRLPTTLNSSQRNLLLCLPLFNTLDGSSAAIGGENHSLPVAESNFALPADFHFRKCNQVISSADTSSQKLLQLLDIKALHSADVIMNFLFPDIKSQNVYCLDETAKIMLWIIARVFEFKLLSSTFIEEMKHLPFVGTDEGKVVKPSELFDPSDATILNLFHGDLNKLPGQYYREAHVVSILREQMGLRTKNEITANELFEVAGSIGHGSLNLSNLKLEAFVNVLNSNPAYLTQNVSTGKSLKSELQMMKWLPCATNREEVCPRFPPSMVWFASDAQYFSPSELCDKSHAMVVGSSMPILTVKFNEIVREELGLTAGPPVEKVVSQLKMAIQLWPSQNENMIGPLFQEMLVAIYNQLSCFPNETVMVLLNNASATHWIWHGSGFCSPSQIALTMDNLLDLRPQLFMLPKAFKDDIKLTSFFLESGVREKFSEDDAMSVLPTLKMKHETSGTHKFEVEKDLKLCRSILEWLVETGRNLTESMLENLLFPVENDENSLILQHYKNCAYCDHDWLRSGESELTVSDEIQLIHNSVPTKIAMTLGVPTLSSCLLSAETLGFEQTGPHEPITTRISNILKEYKEGVGVFKELIQNADDAGASKVRFLVDWRVGPRDRLLSAGMSECQGPALWAYNNSIFSDQDFENINKLAGATKVKDIATIGRFGLGFNAVYHLTDVPSFISRDSFVMFDPNRHHLQNHIRDGSRPGIRINLAKNSKALKAFKNQFQPYHGIFDCNMGYDETNAFHFDGTLFRFPFRTLVQAGKSEICKKVYNEEKVEAIVDSLRESASLLLVYTQHVTEVELFHLNADQKPEQMQIILSVKKTSDFPSNNPPFITTCSDWWINKMQDKASLSERPSKSQLITINLFESITSPSGEVQQSNMQDSWLTNSCMGTGSSCDLALSMGREEGLLPFGETAMKLSYCKDTGDEISQVVPGEAFCFLPLSIPTGLPVHINGYFAITSNRRAIWERGTTEHDQPLEAKWNENLMSDAIVCSYIELLSEVKLRYPEVALTSLHTMLPSYNMLHSAVWEPLVKSFYDKMISESLPLFWCNGKWLDIKSCFILDENLRQVPDVMSTLTFLKRNVIDLAEEICQSFDRSCHKDTLESCTLTLERFFDEFFFPKISEIPHQLREPVVCYGLDIILKGYEKLVVLFKEHKCILNDEGELKKPAELFDPSDIQLQELFYEEPGKFPSQDFITNHSYLSVLQKLGLRNKTMITSEELLNVAKTISSLEYSTFLFRKSHALVNILQAKPDYLSESVNASTTVKEELLSIRWFPRARQPPESCQYPREMPWFETEHLFYSPFELRDKSQALLVGSSMPIADETVQCSILTELIPSILPVEQVVHQLVTFVNLWCNDPQLKLSSQFENMIVSIYRYLAEVPNTSCASALHQADLKHWMWHGAGFCSPSQVALQKNHPLDLRPYLFSVPEAFTDDVELKAFFLEGGVREKFSKDDVVSVLPALKKKHEAYSVHTTETEKDLKLCRSILEWLVETGDRLTESIQEKLLFPVENKEGSLILQHYKNCAYCDHDWLRSGESELTVSDEYQLIHNAVPTKIAMFLGVPTLSSCLLSAETLGFEQTGPHEPITTRISNILKEYKEGVGVFKELIQNADDAGASKVRFLVDWRVGPTDRLLSAGMSECQGPALWAYNNSIFSDQDFENINKLAGATKVEDIATIGRFGLGFNAVYHLTDVPSFISRESFVMFDPNCHHLQNHIRDTARPGIRINLAKNSKALKAFENQFQPYHGIFDCNMDYDKTNAFHFDGTLFRFPFRTLVQAGKSEICKKVYNEEKVEAIVDSLRESASLLLVYTQHVTEVELFHLNADQKPEQMQIILSVKKTSDFPSNNPPFIRTCSDWWVSKMQEKVSLSERPSKSQRITINVFESITSSSGEVQQSNMQDSWLTTSCMGTGSSCDLALSMGREEGLMPFGEAAMKLSYCKDTGDEISQVVPGEAFCFLPLSIPTGFPVHINGYFAITSNRRAIWERGTTEHDQPLEAEWNESLMSDAIACSYIELLSEMKHRYPEVAIKSLHTMLPSYNTLHSAVWEPLVKSFYDKMISECLPLFWCNGKWLDIKSCFILDENLRQVPDLISTLTFLERNVIDLAEEICKSFDKSGHKDTLESCTLTLERFFDEFFFPNVSEIPHQLREPVVSCGLDFILRGHDELVTLFKEHKCILNDEGGLNKPAELFDPNDVQLQELFFEEPGKFPSEDYTANSSYLSVLQKLGLQSKAMITSDDLLNVANTISSSENPTTLIKKSYALMNILQGDKHYLSRVVNGYGTLKEGLQSIRWLPRARSPPDSCRYPKHMPWFDVANTFFSPGELYGKSKALLVGSCMPIVVGDLENSILNEFSDTADLPLEKVILQLSEAIQLWHSELRVESVTEFQDLILAIYYYLVKIPYDLLSKAIKEAGLGQWVWHGDGFASPERVAIENNFLFDLHPHLFFLQNDLRQNEILRNFFVKHGVREKFSAEDIVSVLSSLKAKHELDTPEAITNEQIEHDTKLCRFIVERLVEDDKDLPIDLQSKVVVPVQTTGKSLVLKPCKDCVFFDHEWLRQGRSELDIPEEYFLVDETISTKVAKLLGVSPLSTCLMSGEELDFEQTGQYEPLTTRLNNILKEYKEGSGVFKELVQNADDAGANKVCFLIDWRDGPRKSLFSPDMSDCQGPALWAYNNSVFSDKDFENINKLAGATKVEDFEKIGRFGLGFNAVYHLTDVPSFVSRQYLVIFDPNVRHLRGKIKDKSSSGIRIDLAKNARPLTAFVDQFQPYHDVFHCDTQPKEEKRFHFNGTLFRFPFRTMFQASRSEISQEVYGSEKVEALVNSLRDSIALLLLFTQHVKEIELYELGKTEDPRMMRLILSSQKIVESVNQKFDPYLDVELKNTSPELSFISECSNWWKTYLSGTPALKCPYRSEIISMQVQQMKEKAEDLMDSKEQWLVTSCTGTDSSLQLAMHEGQNHGLLPCAGAAAKLVNCSDSKAKITNSEAIPGEAFCFLPLSVATGLPVHINSSFAIMSNRRGIWEQSSSTQQQDLEVRWNETLMEDAVRNSYILLLETMKSLYDNGEVQDYEFHALWPCYKPLKSCTWKTVVNSVYSKLLENSLPLLRSNGKWLEINQGHILSDDLRKVPLVTEAMQCLNESVFDLPEAVCATLKECGQSDILFRRTLTLKRFFAEFFFPKINNLPDEVRDHLVCSGLDCIQGGQEELELLFKENPCIPCAENNRQLARPRDVINPKRAAAALFSPEDKRFPIGDAFLTEDRVFALEKLGMVKDLLSWSEIFERATSVESLAEVCYDKAVQRSHNLIQYLNKHIDDLPNQQEDEKRVLQEIKFLPFIKEPPKEYKNGLPWRGLKRKKEQFGSPGELFVPHHIDLVGSCCLILSTRVCGKLDKKVKDVLGILRHPSDELVLEQLDNTTDAWSQFNEQERKLNKSKVLEICQHVYEYLDTHLAKVITDDKKTEDDEKELMHELAKRKWLFIDNTFVSGHEVARNWHGRGAPYLYGVPDEIKERHKNLLLKTRVKDNFEVEDFLNAINSVQKSKTGTSLTDRELEVAVLFLNELKNVDEDFVKKNSSRFYLPDELKVLATPDELTINSTPWLKDRGDSRNVHKQITPDLAFKLGAKSLLDKRIGKYSKTMGTPFGQHEDLTDRLKSIFKSYPCDSGILKELVQNADDAQATEIHFIYDMRTLPCENVFQQHAEEIQGPALCVYNNRAFEEKDFDGIQKLGIGSKNENAEKTGQFGIGFNAVYHLTDCPSFLSNGDTLCILDPHCRYAPNATYEYPGERFDQIDEAFLDDFPDVMKGYLGEFAFDLKGSTMFRLPLRTVTNSKISEAVDPKKMMSLLKDFKFQAKRSMLFLNHIKKITISIIDCNSKLKKEYEVISNVDRDDMEQLENLRLHKQTYKDMPTKDIPWKGVTFSLVLYDSNDCIEHWLVNQCYGVKVDDRDGNDEILDGSMHKLLPHGGVAALVSSNQRLLVTRCYFAYCFLPLPVRTSLPVHVNGHFSLDSGRRALWKNTDSNDPLAQWNTVVQKRVLAPCYASLILDAQNYIPFCEREVEDKRSCFFPSEVSADAGLLWYYKLFPDVSDNAWSTLTLAVHAFLADKKKPVLPVVVADKTTPTSADVTCQVQRWLPVQEVFFVDNYQEPKRPEVTRDLMKIFLDIHLPVVRPLTLLQIGFEKAECAVRTVSPKSIVLALRNFCSASAHCRIGILPCSIEATTIGKSSNLRKLITYCKEVENFLYILAGLPLLLTADDVLRTFSREDGVYCSQFNGLFPKRASKFVHPDLVTCLSRVMEIGVDQSVSKDRSMTDLPTDSDAVSTQITPEVLLRLTPDVVAAFMPDVFPEHLRDARTHLDFDGIGVPEEWLKLLWEYLRTLPCEGGDSTEGPLDALKSWPIIPTKSKKLVTVDMGKTVLDMTRVGNESNAALKVRQCLEKLKCPCLDTNITTPETKSSALFARPALKPSKTVTYLYVAHPHSVSDILNVFNFMMKTKTMDTQVLSHEDITAILQFVQDGYQSLEEKEKCNGILKELPFYKAINDKHYKLSDFTEYAVIPDGVPTTGIDTLQAHTRCLFLHSDLLPTFEKLLSGLHVGTKRTTADFYSTYILPNFTLFSDEVRLQHLTHIKDDVLPALSDDNERCLLLTNVKRTRCIPDKTGKYVHASEFYDPRNKVFRVMEDESSNKFPPPPFNETKWLDFLVLIGMLNHIDESLFVKFAERVAREGNLCSKEETYRERSKALLSFLFRNHHLHCPRFLCDLSTVKFIAAEKVEEPYLSLHRQHCCNDTSNHPPFVEFSNAVPWKCRSLIWTSANLLPNWRELSTRCCDDLDCETEQLYKHLQVKYPSPEMVIHHLQNISEVLAESSKKEHTLPQNETLTNVMNGIYTFLQKASNCPPQSEISLSCSTTCETIGTCLANTSCILVDNAKVVVKGDQLSFKTGEERSLEPFIYQVPRDYGGFQHLLKRLGATETITSLQLVRVFKKMKDRTKDKTLNPDFEKKANDAMFLLFNAILKESKEETKLVDNVQELYLPSEDKKLINSSELLCKIPPRHIKVISKLSYHALYSFEKCGLQRELENEYLNALPEKLRPKPFHAVVEEVLDESCLKKPCEACSDDVDCEFISKLKMLLKSKQFKNGIIRLLKHQKNSNDLSQKEETTASRLFLNKVDIKCMKSILVRLKLTGSNELLEESSASRKCYVVKLRQESFALYVEHGKIHGNLAKSINKILDWNIKEEHLLVVSGMLNCATPLEIPETLNDLDIQLDISTTNEDVKLGCEVPVVFHQLLEQNPLFVFHIGERVAFCAHLPDEDDGYGESSFIQYILAEIVKCVSSNSSQGVYDFEARYLIDIGSEKKEVSVLDLYKFCENYPDENSCRDLIPFTGDATTKPSSYDEAKQEILKALRAAWRLPPELRRKAIRRLYLRWHPDKNPNNVEFATEMMAFLLEQIELMKKEESKLAEQQENFDYDSWSKQASRDNSTFRNYQSHHVFPSHCRPFSFGMFDHAATYTTPDPREARRWIKQAEGDLSACRFLLTARKPFHALACFMSQQIVEKSLKAALYAKCGLTDEQLHSHDVYMLARNVESRTGKSIDVANLSAVVANYYLPTRYPNRQPYAIVPFNAFDDKSGDAVRSAAEILRRVKSLVAL